MPKNQVLSFMNNNSNIRVIVDSTNEVLFCLADICKALELTNPSKVKEYLIAEFDEDDLTGSYPIKDNLGRTQNATFITEPQLYYMLNVSRSAKAKPFRTWVNKEVLPSIRKTGAYSILPKTYGEALLEAGRLAIENERLLAQAKENQPKVEAFNELMSSSDSFKKMCGALFIKANKTDYVQNIQKLCKLIQVECGVSDWNTATQEQLKLRDRIHENIALLADVLNNNKEAIRLGIYKAKHRDN